MYNENMPTVGKLCHSEVVRIVLEEFIEIK